MQLVPVGAALGVGGGAEAPCHSVAGDAR